MDNPWRVISNADGVYEEYATMSQAVTEAEKVLALWREQAQAAGTWEEEVEFVEVHLVTHAARIVRRDGDNEDDGVDYGITEILGNEIDEEIRQLRQLLTAATERAEKAEAQRGRMRVLLTMLFHYTYTPSGDVPPGTVSNPLYPRNHSGDCKPMNDAIRQALKETGDE